MLAAAPKARPGRADDLVVIVVPEGQHRVRRLRLGRSLRKGFALTVVAAIVVLQWGLTQAAYVRLEAARVPALLAEHAKVQRRMAGVQQELARLGEQVAQLEQRTTRVQAITQLNDPERNLRLGPVSADDGHSTAVLYAQGERIDVEDELVDGNLAMRLLDHAVEHNKDAVREASQKSEALLGYLATHEGLLSCTPSIYPLSSRLIGSRFGVRADPFTGQEVMHKGLDVLADVGADVWAPADGRVVFAGARGAGYGDVVVIDHGFGVQTHFAHLQNIGVRSGTWVVRGKKIAEVGTTGRTTGAYLHYEVRYNGLPEDPERFLLD